MVSLAMSASGVIVLIIAVDCSHNLHPTPAPVIWDPKKNVPPVDCEDEFQKIWVGEAKDGQKCGPSTATRGSEWIQHVDPARGSSTWIQHVEPDNDILVCCESGLKCKKGRNEYKCKASKRQMATKIDRRMERNVEALSEEGTSLDQAKEEGKSLDNAKSKSQVKRAL